MTQYPQPGPIPYATSQPARPTPVTVLAIIGIILGAFGLLGGICGLVGAMAATAISKAAAQQNPAMVAMHGSTLMTAWTIIGGIASIALAGLLLASSIASLGMKPWGRRMMVNYAFAAIVLNVIGLIMTFAVVLPAMREALAGDPGASGGLIGGIAGGLGGAVVGLIYPICILIFMRRPDIVAAFEAPTRSYPGPTPGSYPPPPQH